MENTKNEQQCAIHDVMCSVWIVVANEYDNSEIFFVGYTEKDANHFIDKIYDGNCELMVIKRDVIHYLVKGDKVIWDSHFGYEIGYFIGEGNQDNTWLIDIKSGICKGECSYSKNQIYKYSDELIDKLTEKYNYEKRFRR